MKETIHKITSKLRFLYNFFKSLLFGWLMKAKFNKVQTFVMFIGYPRSGHSLIGALLDAHPNIVMGMEWDVFRHIKMGFNQNMIFYSILHNSKIFNRRLENVWTGYSYKVNDMWQGKYKELRVIGDKQGGWTANLIRKNPNLLNQLEKLINKRIVFIHVIRNPFDIITTIAKRVCERENEVFSILALLPAIKRFFEKVEIISLLKEKEQIVIFELYHEDFINSPENILKNLIKFLAVNNYENYIQECSRIIYNSPNKSRFQIDWPDHLILFVQNTMNQYDYLKRYSFHE